MTALSGQTCGTSQLQLQGFFLTCSKMLCSLSVQFCTAAAFLPEVEALEASVRVPRSSGNGTRHQGLPLQRTALVHSIFVKKRKSWK